MFIQTATPRRQLEAKRANLEEYIRNHNNLPGQAYYGNHPAEAASDVCERGIQLAFVFDAERRLEQVQKALRRIDEGTYRLCEGCGQSIDQARLVAIPAASLCITCQRKHETRCRSRCNGHYP